LKGGLPFNETFPDEPQLLQDSSGRYWVVFSEINGSSSYIGYATSTDSVNWSSVAYVFKDDATITSNPTIAEAFGRIWVAWDTNAYRNKGDRGAIVISSFDGAEWSEPMLLFNHTDLDEAPHLASAGGRLHIVFSSDRHDDVYFQNPHEDQVEHDIYYASSDNGLDWPVEPEWVVRDIAESDNPSLTVDLEGNLILVWDTDLNELGGRGIEHNIYYSKLEGKNWTDPTYLTCNSENEIKGAILQDSAGDFLILYLRSGKLLLQRISQLPFIGDFQPRLEVQEGEWITSSGETYKEILRIDVNEKAKKTLTTLNKGNNILRGKIYTSEDRWIRVTQHEFALMPGESLHCEIRVDFDEAGDYEGYVKIESNDQEKPLTIIPISVAVREVAYQGVVPKPPVGGVEGWLVLTVMAVIAGVAILVGFKLRGKTWKRVQTLLLTFLLLTPAFSPVFTRAIPAAAATETGRLMDTPTAPSPYVINSTEVVPKLIKLNHEETLWVKATTTAQGMLGYWRMDEAIWSGAPNEVVDSSGYGYHGTASGGANTTDGKLRRAGSFDGKSWVEVPTYGSISTGMTVMAWVKLSATGKFQFVVSNEGYGTISVPGQSQPRTYITGFGFGISNDNKVRFEYGSTTFTFAVGASGNTQLSPGTWYHVAATWNGKTVKVYLNGQVDGQRSMSQYIPSNRSLYIGTNPTIPLEYGFSGLIDEVYIYNYALSDDAIRSYVEDSYILQAVYYDPNGNEIPIQEIDLGPMDVVGRSFVISWNFTSNLAGVYLVAFGLWNSNKTQLLAKLVSEQSPMAPTSFIVTNVYIASAEITWEPSFPNSLDVYFVAAADAPGANTISPDSIRGALDRLSSNLGISFNYHYITSTSQLAEIVESPRKMTILINTHGGVLPIPHSYVRRMEATSDVKALYHFEEPSLSGYICWKVPVQDSSPNSNDGWLSSSPEYAYSYDPYVCGYDPRKLGGYALNAAQAYVTVRPSPSFKLPKFSTEFWVCPKSYSTSTNIETLVSAEGTFKGWGFHVVTGEFDGAARDNEIKFFIGDGNTFYSVYSGSRMSLNTWHKILGAYDGVEMRLYVDGALVASKMVNASIVYGNEPLSIGGSAIFHDYGGRRFDGLIDEVAVRELEVNEIDNNLDFVSWIENLRNFIMREGNVWLDTGYPFSQLGLSGLYPGRDAVNLRGAGLNLLLNFSMMPPANMVTSPTLSANITVQGERLRKIMPGLSLPDTITLSSSSWELPENYREEVIPVYREGNLTSVGVVPMGQGGLALTAVGDPDIIASLSLIMAGGRDVRNYIERNKYKGEEVSVNSTIYNDVDKDIPVSYEYFLTDPFSAESIAYQQNLTLKPGINHVNFKFPIGIDEAKGTYLAAIAISNTNTNETLDFYGDTFDEMFNLTFNAISPLVIESFSPIIEVFSMIDTVKFNVSVKNYGSTPQSFKWRLKVQSENKQTFTVKCDNKTTVSPNNSQEFLVTWNPNIENGTVPRGNFTAFFELYDGDSISYVNQNGTMVETKTAPVDIAVHSFQRTPSFCLSTDGDRVTSFVLTKTDGNRQPYPVKGVEMISYSSGDRAYLEVQGAAACVGTVGVSCFDIDLFVVAYGTDGKPNTISKISQGEYAEFTLSLLQVPVVKFADRLSPADLNAYNWTGGVTGEYDSDKKEAYLNVPGGGEWVEYKLNVQEAEFIKINLKSYNPPDHTGKISLLILDANGNPVTDALLKKVLSITFEFDDKSGGYESKFTYIYRLPKGSYLFKLSSADENPVRIVSISVVPQPSMAIAYNSAPSGSVAFTNSPDNGTSKGHAGIFAYGGYLDIVLPTFDFDIMGWVQFAIVAGFGWEPFEGYLHVRIGIEVTVLGSPQVEGARDQSVAVESRGIFTVAGDMEMAVYDFDKGVWLHQVVEVHAGASIPLYAVTSQGVKCVLSSLTGGAAAAMATAMEKAGWHCDWGIGFFLVIGFHFTYPIGASAPKYEVSIGPQFSFWWSLYYSKWFIKIKIAAVSFSATMILLTVIVNAAERAIYLAGSFVLCVTGTILIVEASFTFSFDLYNVRVGSY
jgi:hypothetical protein